MILGIDGHPYERFSFIKIPSWLERLQKNSLKELFCSIFVIFFLLNEECFVMITNPKGGVPYKGAF